MSRVVFERSVCDGFRTSKVDQITSSAFGRRVFAGTVDGVLVSYECRQESSSIGRVYNCKILETIKKQAKDRKQISCMTQVESWRVFLCICDGVLTAFDSQFFQHLTTIPESKGCHLLSVNEKQFSIVIAVKKKLAIYSWQQPNMVLRKELPLQDIPKGVWFLQNSVIIGYRKFYESVDVATGIYNRILDFEKEHKLICVEIPKTSIRVDSLLLSIGLQAVILSVESICTGRAFAYGSVEQERVEWASAPLQCHLLNPFILSALTDSSIEVHDLASLLPLQRLPIISPSPHVLSISVCSDDASKCGPPPNFAYHVYVCNGEQLSILKMIPLLAQVELMVAAGQFEQAISMCKVCSNSDLLVGIDLIFLYEAAAKALLAKGDFEKAVQNFILAKTDFADVARNFHDLIPLPLHISLNVYQTKKLSGSVLVRAATAMVKFCEHHRPRMLKRASIAEKIRDTGIIGTASRNLQSWKQSPDLINDEEEEYIVDPDDEIRRAQLLDTVLLFSLMNCNPIRRGPVIDLLSSFNRCHLESCSILLASHGNTFTEALLWLYRSQNQHSRVLQALTEDKCVAIGAWTTEQFYSWTADYLRWLWYNEDDSTLPRQALTALKPVLEYDAELGLSVLVCRPPQKDTFGGKGVTITEVLAFLRSTSPKINYYRTNLSYGSSFVASNKTLTKLRERGSIWTNEKGIADVIATTPLLNGHALGVAFLECLISSGEAPPNMHDEFAQLLVEGLQTEVANDLVDLEIRSDDNDHILLLKIYRRKLQLFLANSQDYHPNRILKCLPRTYHYENALVLSKLGRHRDVLKIYLELLNDQALAEQYSEFLFLSMSGIGVKPERKLGGNFSHVLPAFKSITGIKDPGDIYLILFEVMLAESQDTEEYNSNLKGVIKLAEKYSDRFDPVAFLQILPSSASIALLVNYFKVVLETQTTHKRCLQIIHQLLRKREVLMRTETIK